ncbi:MAG: DUF2461 domain-containing protein [Deltaproteobacteria bacterium]|nr:DUF2461 domain-containing protein [Deltaproteobacteria bacterium]
MTEWLDFNGFPPECPQFYRDLSNNNNKAWFDQHKSDYERYCLIPARQFVAAMGLRLAAISPQINAIPQVNQSLFRINRDTRFSREKIPYKTHLGIVFWEGNRPRMESSCFYFQLEPDRLMLAAGIKLFSKPILDEYRRSVADKKIGQSLLAAISEVTGRGPYYIGDVHYKKVPKGYTPAPETAGLILHNTLYAAFETSLPQELHSTAILDYCYAHFSAMAPIHKWLAAVIDRTSS